MRSAVPLLLVMVGTGVATAEPVALPHARYVDTASVPHIEVRPEASAPSVVTPTEVHLHLDAPPARRPPTHVHREILLVPQQGDEPASAMDQLERTVMDSITAVRTESMQMLAMPQLIRCPSGSVPGMGVKIRF